jgi:acid phosphatase type 7
MRITPTVAAVASVITAIAIGSCSTEQLVDPLLPTNQRPTVTLTAPVAGGSAAVNTPVTVSATASDADGTVRSVEFFDGASSIGRDTTSPYGITWTPTTAGARSLTARVTDDADVTATSSGRLFIVTSLPGGAEPFVGAGDIASCTGTGDEATAALLDGIAGTVFTLGDNVYDNGTATEFANCYDPSWGHHKSRTKPVAGNHDYNTSGASGYYDYFSDAAGPRDKGYYSFDLGAWHIIVLNSNISRTATSEQIGWLRADLTGSTAQCTMALWHHPRFSSGYHGDDATQQPFWDVLYEFDADVVLVGHDHDYERFAPQTPTGVADPTRGLRQFVVGTGGTSLRSFSAIRSNSEFRNNSTWGVIKFDLNPTGYSWFYITTTGRAVLDSGSGSCH